MDPTEKEYILRIALELAFEDGLMPRRERDEDEGVRAELLWEEWEGEHLVQVCATSMSGFWNGNIVLLRRSCHYYSSSCRVPRKDSSIRSRRVFKV